MAAQVRKLFGTDGIRGIANKYPMDPTTITKIGQAAGLVFLENNGVHRHKVIIFKDPRLSGYMIEPALTAGFTSVGMDVYLTGPLPTPAAALLTYSMRCDLGVMITASHNPFHDNGLKFFGADGYKLSDELEEKIETLLGLDLSSRLAPPELMGRTERVEDVQGRYIELVKNSLPSRLTLKGLKVVIDTANGAAYKVASLVLKELDATIIAIGDRPDGLNINKDVGSTNPHIVASTVLRERAHVGIALDGDADRLIMVDELGQVVDGDQILAILAKTGKEKGWLKGGVVATVMSNFGLERYLKTLGLELVRTQVGDRFVNEKMRELDWNVGGEQSGHIILPRYGKTGDGLIAALQMLAYLKQDGRRASECFHVFSPVPQVLKNLKYEGTSPLTNPKVKAAIKAAERKLEGRGHLVVRNSGTEPLIRIMAQGDDSALTEQAVARVVEAVQAAA